MKRTKAINGVVASRNAATRTPAAAAVALLSRRAAAVGGDGSGNKKHKLPKLFYLGILLVSIHILYQQYDPDVSSFRDGDRRQQQVSFDCMEDELVAGQRQRQRQQQQHTVHSLNKNKGNAPARTDSSSSPSSSSSSSSTTNDSSFSRMSHNNNIVIDMISIGSHSRPHYPVIQQASFGSHRAVRHFWTFTEDNDDDQQCHNMTIQMVQQVANLCRRPSTYSKLPLMKRHFAPSKWLLEKTKNPVGWLCAQKRPLTALHQVLTGYYYPSSSSSSSSSNNNNTNNNTNNNNNSPVAPDYLFVMDDDSWFHLERMLPVLQQDYPPHQAHLIAGCLIRSPKDERFAFYWGGFGIILTKAVIERLLVPLTCQNHPNDDKGDDGDGDARWSHHLPQPALPWHDTRDFQSNQDFVQYACHRIALNLIGEQYFYRPGMSLIDLIYQYGLQQPYSQVDQWRTDATYCMHSDTTLAYFWQYYHVAHHANNNNNNNNPSSYASVDYDRMDAYRGSIKIKVSDDKRVKPPVFESRGECAHVSNDDCTTDSHVCHYVTAGHMKELFEAIKI